jgi:hypothetical protein
MTPLHTFDDTEDAYTACQCDENVKRGDVLHIPSEGVVGLGDTWPVAVTVAYGELHTVKPTLNVYGFRWGLEQVQDAVRFAQERGYPVHPAFLRAMTGD